MKENNSLNLDLVSLIQLIRNWKKQLIIVVISAFVLSIIFTMPWFIKPLFKSYAVVYPSNLIVYSEESPTEQLIQQFNSDIVRDRIIDVFNLYQHYDIDTNQAFPKTAMQKRYQSLVSIDKTQFESVNIEVLDTDPLMAAKICDSLIAFTNQNIKDLQRSKTAEVVIINRDRMLDIKRELDSLDLILAEIRRANQIIDFNVQTKEFSRSYYKAVAGNQSGLGNLRNEGEKLRIKGSEILAMVEFTNALRYEYVSLKSAFMKSVSDLHKELTYCNLITKPIPAERKTSPKRSMIVLLVTFTVSFMALLSIIFIEKYRLSIKPLLEKK
ncbi:MAG TPA: hypothetical protein PKH65_05905 [Bacteroidia bacterium]|nr:hypothetical protein [Bacteroidia bacterium]HNT80198.1 hypothetical protein [Bacteroidia bacterium]